MYVISKSKLASCAAHFFFIEFVFLTYFETETFEAFFKDKKTLNVQLLMRNTCPNAIIKKINHYDFDENKFIYLLIVSFL